MPRRAAVPALDTVAGTGWAMPARADGARRRSESRACNVCGGPSFREGWRGLSGGVVTVQTCDKNFHYTVLFRAKLLD